MSSQCDEALQGERDEVSVQCKRTCVPGKDARTEIRKSLNYKPVPLTRIMCKL